MDLRSFILDTTALALARASDVLALAPSAVGRIFTLGAVEPPTVVSGPGAEPADELQVAIVSIDGPLAQRRVADLCGYVDGYDAVTARVSKALAKPEVGAVVLRINSPGGDVAGIEEAVRRMSEARTETGKPIFAYVDEYAASAAYWIAAGVGVDGVYVPTSGEVGSIGCLAMHVDQSKALEQKGLAVTLMRDPPGKAAGHPAEPIGELARERIGQAVSDAATRFIGAMATARGLSAAAVRAMNGATYEGQRAVDAGLADGVKSLEEVVQLARQEGARRNSEMKLNRALAALLMVSVDASEEDVTKATAALAPALEVGRAAIALAGGKDAEHTLATVQAWQTAAKRVGELDAEKATREAAEQVAADKAEEAERFELVQGMATQGRLKPPEAWASSPEKGFHPDNGIAATWQKSTIKIKSLRAVAKSLGPIPGMGAVKPAPDAATETDKVKAQELGVSVESYVASRNEIQQARHTGAAVGS